MTRSNQREGIDWDFSTQDWDFESPDFDNIAESLAFADLDELIFDIDLNALFNFDLDDLLDWDVDEFFDFDLGDLEYLTPEEEYIIEEALEYDLEDFEGEGLN